ncbi:hypothetical protein EJB05_19852, partial [Eragrostis curvula]
MEAITGRATLLVVAALLLSSGLAAAAAATAAEVKPARHNPNCKRILDPNGGPCGPELCKLNCKFTYNGHGMCVPLGCQCDYCPPGVPGPPASVRRMAMHGH